MASGEKAKKDKGTHRSSWRLFGGDVQIGVLLATCLFFKFGPAFSRPYKAANKTGSDAVAAAPAEPRSDALTSILPTGFSFGSTTKEEVKPAEVEKEPPSIAAATQTTEPPPPLPSDPLMPAVAVAKEGHDPGPPPKLETTTVSNPSDQPIVPADLPHKPTEPDNEPKSESTSGPIHPYYQRFLDQKEYFVRAGDTLELIARRLYRNEARAKDLLAANKELLAKNTKLKPGMIIKLP